MPKILMLKTISVSRTALAMGAFLLGMSNMSASEMELSFTGTINQSDVAAIPIGTEYSGYVLYQTPGTGCFTIGSVTGCSMAASDAEVLNVGSFMFAILGSNVSSPTSSLEVTYHDPANGDVFGAGVISQQPSPISSNLPGFLPDFLYVQIAGPAGMLSSNGLPTAIDLSKVAPFYYGNAAVGITVASFGDSSQPPIPLFSGGFSSLQFQEVPEPATAFMLAFAIAGLWLGRKYSNPAAKRT